MSALAYGSRADCQSPIADSRRASANRGQPDDLLPCPNCSRRSVPHNGAMHPHFTNGRHSGAVMLLHCCELSRIQKPFADWPRDAENRRVVMSEAQASAWRFTCRVLIANWWRVRRLQGNAEMLQWLRENRGITPEMEELA